MQNANDPVTEFLLNQLRQQLTNNPYKQQCEDLAHEVLSLKNQLRDASALVAKLHKELEYTGNEYRRAIDYALSDAPEQSGFRKEDTQECYHNWRFVGGKSPAVCINCGETRHEECDHNWSIAPGLFIAEGHKDNVPGSRFCCECGAREWDDGGYKPKEDTQKCKHEWEYYYPNGEEHQRCAKCGVIDYEF